MAKSRRQGERSVATHLRGCAQNRKDMEGQHFRASCIPCQEENIYSASCSFAVFLKFQHSGSVHFYPFLAATAPAVSMMGLLKPDLASISLSVQTPRLRISLTKTSPRVSSVSFSPPAFTTSAQQHHYHTAVANLCVAPYRHCQHGYRISEAASCLKVPIPSHAYRYSWPNNNRPAH